MHYNKLFQERNLKNFLGSGTAPPQTPPHVRTLSQIRILHAIRILRRLRCRFGSATSDCRIYGHVDQWVRLPARGFLSVFIAIAIAGPKIGIVLRYTCKGHTDRWTDRSITYAL